MNELSVYQYQSARLFLRDAIEDKKRSDPSFSIRKFCKASDFGTHAHLVMILKGRRAMTLKQVPALVRGLSLGSEERIYLQTLIQLDNAKSDEEKDLYRLWLNDINPKREFRMIEVEQYHVIADWIHMAILTLAKIPGVEITPESIYTLVRGKVSLSQVRQAIDRLLDLKLLEEKDGRLSPSFHSVRTRDDVSSRGAREYHKQAAKLAIDAVEEQSPSEREFQSFALAIPGEKISLAKDMIRKFRMQLAQVLEAETPSDVYQCNIQFFRLLDRPSGVVLKTATKETVQASAEKVVSNIYSGLKSEQGEGHEV